MPKKRPAGPRGEDAVRERWERACGRLPILSTSSPVPVLAAEPMLIRSLKGLVGNERDALRAAMHAVIDRRIVNAEDRSAVFMPGISKPAAFAVPVAGTAFRLRIHADRGTVLDLVGEGGSLCDDDIVLDAVLPQSLIDAAVGRRADGVMANPRGLFDGSRPIRSGHVRFARQTVLRLEPTTPVGLTYAELFGNPRRRFPPLRWPTAPSGGRLPTR